MTRQSTVRTSMGSLRPAVDTALAELRDRRIVTRIADRDHTVWKPAPTEISNRLGWLDSPASMPDLIPEIGQVVAAAQGAL